MCISEIKLFSDILSNLSIIIAAIIPCTTFKFKLGVDERKLYLDNANKVREVFSNVMKYARVDDEHLVQIGIAFEEASLYLNKDFCEEVCHANFVVEKSLSQSL